MLLRKMELAAQEREDAAIALIEQQVSSTAPKRRTETRSVAQVKQAAPAQDQCPRKANTGRSSAHQLSRAGRKGEKSQHTGRTFPKLWAGHRGIARSRKRRAVEITSKGSPWRTWRRDTADQGQAQCHFRLSVPASKSETGTTTPHLGAIHRLH